MALPGRTPYPLAVVVGCSLERIKPLGMQRRLLRPRRAVRQRRRTAAQSDIDAHEANHPSGGAGVDQTARDAAAAAQGTADGAQTAAAKAHAAQSTLIELTPHETDTVARSTAANARQIG